MPIQLSSKESMLLQDLQNYEQLCVQKYSNYANSAQDPQLKQLFQSLSSREQQHLNTVNQIMSGQVPNMNQSQGQQGQGQQGVPQGITGGAYNQNDAYLVNDLLATEKHASSAYDTAIFEFQDTNVRQALNHIQKEEQEHGEYLFNYMKSHGMYNVK
jgi:spore coat protein CotF